MDVPSRNIIGVFCWLLLVGCSIDGSSAFQLPRPSSILAVELVSQITEKSLVIRLKCELPVAGADVRNCTLVETHRNQLASTARKIVAASVNSTRPCFTDITLGPNYGTAEFECEIIYRPTSGMASCSNNAVSGLDQGHTGNSSSDKSDISCKKSHGWRPARRLSRSRPLALTDESGGYRIRLRY